MIRIKSSLVLIAILTVASLIPRLWQLAYLPPIIVDEPADLRDINIILTKGFYFTNFAWDWSKSFLVYGVPLIFINILKMPASIYTLRLSSVVVSVLGVPALFLLIKRHTNSLVAFLTSLLYMYSYYFLQFSRVGGWLNVVFVNTLGLYLFLILENAIQRKSVNLFALSGIVSGLIFYSYRSGWVYIGVAFIYLIISLIKSGLRVEKVLSLHIVYLLSFLIVIFPWLLRIRTNWEMFFLRQNVVSINNVARPYHNLYEKSDTYLYQVVTSVKGMFFLHPVDGGGNENSRYLPLTSPPVNNVIRIGYLVGLIIAFLSFSKTFYWYLIIIFGIILGQILTVDPPNGARGLIILPFIYLFFSLSLNNILSINKSNIYKFFIILLVLLLCFSDFKFYQDWMTWIKV